MNSKYTNPFKRNIGTRQGDITSTILFNLYINELCPFLRQRGHRGIFVNDRISDIICVLFADDVANCADTDINLQLQLNSIAEFCEQTGMEINKAKTEIIVFRYGGPLRNYESWTYDGSQVNVTHVYKYMGILHTPKLSWTKAKSKLSCQVKKSVYAIKTYDKRAMMALYCSTG